MRRELVHVLEPSHEAPIHDWELLGSGRTLPYELHREIHNGGPRGGRWNAAWEKFFKENPDARAEDVYRFAGQLLYEFELDGRGRMVGGR